MYHKFVLAVLVGSLLTSIARAEDPDNWLTITASPDFLFYGKKGSAGISNVDGKQNAGYVYVYQKENKKKKTYEYGQLIVKLNACQKGYGYIYYNDMDGKYKDKDAFVRFGRTVADALGSAACTSWDEYTGKVSGQDKGDTWEVAAETANSNTKYSIKTDTVRKRSYNGKSVIAALYSEYSVKDDYTTYGEYVVAMSDCRRGFGTVYDIDFDGVLTTKFDVALNGSSVGSQIANTLCKKS